MKYIGSYTSSSKIKSCIQWIKLLYKKYIY